MLGYWPYAWKQNIFLINIFFCWRKPGILIPDLYIYSIKIQTDIDQNTVIKLQKNHKFFEIIFEEFLFFYLLLFFFGLDPAGPTWLGSTQQASREQWNNISLNYFWSEQWNSISLFKWIIFHLNSEMQGNVQRRRGQTWWRWRGSALFLVVLVSRRLAVTVVGGWGWRCASGDCSGGGRRWK
jgi:hypothetical protein